MNCPCCQPGSINDLDNTFDTSRAEGDARHYLKKGLDKRAQKLIAPLVQRAAELLSVLDIGCGAGGVHHELLRRHLAHHAIGVDASSAYLAAARQNAQQLGLADAVEYFHRDFALTPDEFGPADLVVMDRVICCYPHLEPLLGAAAQRAQRYLALSFPIESRWFRLPYLAIKGLMRLFGSQYFFYLHPHTQVVTIAAKEGLRPLHRDRSGLWQIMVFGR